MEVVKITVKSLKALEHSNIIAYHMIGAIVKEIENLKDMYFYGANELHYNALYEQYKAEISLLKDEIDPEELLFVHLEHYNRHIHCLFDMVLEPPISDKVEEDEALEF